MGILFISILKDINMKANILFSYYLIIYEH